ncbi:MAG: tRNA (adenosine(37)-N6)-threonylcarbamoyltransferase complex transferase subunit TsaD [Legionellales bacterium]|nr:tRNA (adenosine(37)-N6)-threonylcarbamoyltransferase complex transferase subunit TsaD [Legionellales bacterium]OUX67498.1 MAG: tRNA (adenosine(37)-N6)-threonylcarbamoyltransferase complex transferase subunit TsaD [bacterium TMED178]|tara:strand:- start:2818 stop:3813 length:996 start_codon:yes stop_codon:yes gene_type:complete
MITLGIETSCDDTGIALYDSERGLLANKLVSQLDTHKPFGGVVPELASRDHQNNIIALIDHVFKESHLSLDQIDLISYTAGPGLVGSLMVGAGVAYGLSQAKSIPIIGVHHHLAHLEIAMLNNETIEKPYLGLLVSGGHTYFIQVAENYSCRILGSTIDDAVGEALDKSARVMGLGYPGGPILDQLSQTGHAMKKQLPRPMIHDKSLNMSFSGLKTALVKSWQDDHPPVEDLSLELITAVSDVLEKKLSNALKLTELKHVVFAGGVAANRYIRTQLTTCVAKYNAQLHIPDRSLCTDNGAMIAYLGYLLYRQGANIRSHFVNPSWSIEELL